METSHNLAARAGRWSAAHWKTATVLWLVFVVVAIVLGRAAGTVKLTDSEQGTGETARAQAILAQAGFKTPASENVLVESKSLTAGGPAIRGAGDDVTRVRRTIPQG
jgi:RND superfamily putative drug exporter